MNNEVMDLEDIKLLTRKTSESATTYDDQQDQQSSLDENDIVSNISNSDSMTSPNIQINYATHSHSHSHSNNNNKFTNNSRRLHKLNMVNNVSSTQSVPYNRKKYRSKYTYFDTKSHKYPASVIDDDIQNQYTNEYTNDDIDDEKCIKYRLKRANTWTAPQKNDLINQFIAKNFNTETAMAKLSKISQKKYNNLSKDALIKRVRIVYDRANSLTNTTRKRDLAIESFVECLNIIYLLYNYSLFLNEIEKSSIIGQHMNVVLNLGVLYTNNTKNNNGSISCGLALKMYAEAQLLYELDENGFKKSNINGFHGFNLKSYILRGMADVYIKQAEYLSALGLLEEALQLAQQSNDREAMYQILCTKGRALFDAKQLQKASRVFDKAVLILLKIHKQKARPYDLYDRDLYRNTALCYKCIAQEFCSVVYVNSTKTYAIKNTEKSMQFWNKAAKAYHETVKIVKHLFGTHSFEYVQALYEWSDVLCTKGNYNKSYHIYQNVQTLFQQFDNETQGQHTNVIEKTKQMIQTLRPYINDNTL